jgi:monomeric sarcosine oxidase
MKVAVIGVGATGSSALRFLSREGHEAVGFEQHEVGHARGSSHGESRIIRYTYPDPLYTRLMRDAYALWDELESEANEELFVRCGGLYFGPSDDIGVQNTESALAESGLPYSKFLPSEAKEKVPALEFFDNETILFQGSSGFLRAGACVAANARLAQKHGAQIRESTRVTKIENRGSQVLVHSDMGEEIFDSALVTAGAWMKQVLAEASLPLRVTRQQYVYLKPENPALFSPDVFPVWIDKAHGFYGFPIDGRTEGVKLARHDFGEEFDPNRDDRPLRDEEIEEALTFARRRLPGLTSQVLEARACLYTVTPDEDFLIDRAPGLSNTWMISACSGHGFKFTSLLGRIGANLSTRGEDERDLSRFKLNRF